MIQTFLLFTLIKTIMNNKILFLLLLIVVFPALCMAQPSIMPGNTALQVIHDRGGRIIDSLLIIPVRDTSRNVWNNDQLKKKGQIALDKNTGRLVYHNGERWIVAGEGSGGGSEIDTAYLDEVLLGKVDTFFDWTRPIRRSGLGSLSFPTQNLLKGLEMWLYPSLPAQVDLRMNIAGLGISNATSFSIEKRPVNTYDVTLSWTATRQAETDSIASITVAGVTQSGWTQPAAPGSVTGTQAASYTTNNSISFNITVVTKDGQTTSLNRSGSTYDRKYAGWMPVGQTVPDNAQILAAVYKDINGTSKSISTTLVNPGGSYIPFVAYPTATVSTKPVFKDGNLFDISDNFTPNVVTFTNQHGYVSSYTVYVYSNATSGNFQFSSQ